MKIDKLCKKEKFKRHINIEEERQLFMSRFGLNLDTELENAIFALNTSVKHSCISGDFSPVFSLYRLRNSRVS